MEQEDQKTIPPIVKQVSRRWKWVIFILAVAIVCGAGIVKEYSYPSIATLAHKDGVPYSVESQYSQTEPTGPAITSGVYLYKCELGYRLIHDAVEYYFDVHGTPLGTYQDTDMHDSHYIGPTVNIGACKMFKQKMWK